MGLRQKIRRLEEKAEPLNNPATFSKWAKINREVTALKDQESALNQAVEWQKAKRISTSMQLRILQIIMWIIILYYTWGKSLAPIPLGMKSFWFSNITPFTWITICYVVVKRFG